jgi:hypothetical protein
MLLRGRPIIHGSRPMLLRGRPIIHGSRLMLHSWGSIAARLAAHDSQRAAGRCAVRA